MSVDVDVMLLLLVGEVGGALVVEVLGVEVVVGAGLLGRWCVVTVAWVEVGVEVHDLGVRLLLVGLGLVVNLLGTVFLSPCR